MSSTQKAKQRKLKRASTARDEARVHHEAHLNAERLQRLAKSQLRIENAEKAVKILAAQGRKSAFRSGTDGNPVSNGMNPVGYVQEYPCDCQGNGAHVCWIVRHPNCQPPVSYRTKLKATRALNRLRKENQSGQKATDS